jgi:hypothetical protein
VKLLVISHKLHKIKLFSKIQILTYMKGFLIRIPHKKTFLCKLPIISIKHLMDIKVQYLLMAKHVVGKLIRCLDQMVKLVLIKEIKGLSLVELDTFLNKLTKFKTKIKINWYNSK